MLQLQNHKGHHHPQQQTHAQGRASNKDQQT